MGDYCDYLAINPTITAIVVTVWTGQRTYNMLPMECVAQTQSWNVVD